METINNVASAAAKAVWGSPESKEEPINGVKGNTQAGQPYDAGNMEAEQAQVIPTPGQEKSPAELHPPDSSGTSGTLGTSATPATAGTTPTEKDNSQASDPAAVGKPELRDIPNAAEHVSKPVAADSTAGGQHDISSPSERPEENPVPEATLKEPGPKPLEVVAREHGGDAGNIANDGKDTKAAPSAPADIESDDGPQKESHGEGTGEKVVKASGFAAEGGDFDAAKAGAGYEADRLREEHNDSPVVGDSHKHTAHSATKHTPDPAEGSEEKKSLKDRIKAKLHKH